jgi:hypothetical protein
MSAARRGLPGCPPHSCHSAQMSYPGCETRLRTAKVARNRISLPGSCMTAGPYKSCAGAAGQPVQLSAAGCTEPKTHHTNRFRTFCLESQIVCSGGQAAKQNAIQIADVLFSKSPPMESEHSKWKQSP